MKFACCIANKGCNDELVGDPTPHIVLNTANITTFSLHKKDWNTESSTVVFTRYHIATTKMTPK